MHLSRQGVEHYKPGPTTDPTVDPTDWAASFDGGDTWVDAEVVDSAPAWLVAGPDATGDVGTAVVLPDVEWLVPALKFANAPETIIRDQSFDNDQRPPAIYLT